MKSSIKRLLAGVSAIAMLSILTVNPVFADETTATMGGTSSSTAEILLNEYNKPLTEDGIHGDTNLEDMEYIHYELSDIQDVLDSMENLSNVECNDSNLEKFFELELEMNTFAIKVNNSLLLSNLYYNQEPIIENLIEYTHTSTLFDEYRSIYNNTIKTVMSGSFGTDMLNTLQLLSSSSELGEFTEIYAIMYEYYSNFLYSDFIDEDVQAVQSKINEKLNQYFTLIQTNISNYSIEFNGEQTTYSEIQNRYLTLYNTIVNEYSNFEDIPEEVLDEYYSLEDAIKIAKTENGIDNNTLAQLYIDIVKLYNEYAQTVDSANYIDLTYEYDIDKISQICSDVKEYIAPIIEKYSLDMSNNSIFGQTVSQEFTIDEAKELSRTVISSVGDKYLQIYDYMDNHNLLSLDDDYIFVQGYTTSLPEYSEAYIYMTFENNNFYNWFTNGISHEFGHFIDWYQNLDDFLVTNMANSENVSISFSYICNDNLDAYFDENTSNILSVSNTIDNVYNYVNHVLSLSEFELYAFQNIDIITIDDLNQKYLELYHDYGLINDLEYQLGYANQYTSYVFTNQIYTMPFYMTDYAMAGLTSLNVFDTYIKDNQTGLELFESLYNNDYYYDDYTTMMIDGLGIDIYADDYVINTAKNLDNYLSSKMQLIKNNPNSDGFELGDLNLDGSIDPVDLVILKKYILGMDISNLNVDMSKADLNQDSNINILDLLTLKRMILGIL